MANEVIQIDPEKPQDVAVSRSMTGGLTIEELDQSIEVEKKKRDLLKKFVKSQLVEGVDYGAIKAESKSGKSFETKPVLMKPGQEKIFSLFGISDEIMRDDETREMFREQSDLICYKCIVKRNGLKIAEGRGAAKLGEKGRGPNETIKIAEKRARMDACLALGFSEYFTQDTDDLSSPEKPQTQRQNYRKPPELISQDQLDRFTILIANSEDQDKLHTWLLKATNVGRLEQMTKVQADNYLRALEKKYNQKKPTDPTPPAPNQDKPTPPAYVMPENPASEDQRKKIFALANDLGQDAEKVKAWVKVAFRLESFTQLSKDQANKIIKVLQDRLDEKNIAEVDSWRGNDQKAPEEPTESQPAGEMMSREETDQLLNDVNKVFDLEDKDEVITAEEN